MTLNQNSFKVMSNKNDVESKLLQSDVKSKWRWNKIDSKWCQIKMTLNQNWFEVMSNLNDDIKEKLIQNDVKSKIIFIAWAGIEPTFQLWVFCLPIWAFTPYFYMLSFTCVHFFVHQPEGQCLVSYQGLVMWFCIGNAFFLQMSILTIKIFLTER